VGSVCTSEYTGIIARTWFNFSFLRIVYLPVRMVDPCEKFTCAFQNCCSGYSTLLRSWLLPVRLWARWA
jgi:hypothetical protein